MKPSPLSLVEIQPRKMRKYFHTFDHSEQFAKPWWGRVSSPSKHEHWLSIRSGEVEVARCKFYLYEAAPSHPLLGDMPHGQLDILALEVAKTRRGKGIGREILRLIRVKYPLVRLTALNDDDHSRGFWESVGWIRYESPREFLRSERATYSEV